MKNISLILMLAFLGLSLVSAADTTLVISTMPGYEFEVTLAAYPHTDPSTLLGYFSNKTDATTGEVSFVLTSDSSQLMTFSTSVTLGGKIIQNKRFGTYANYTAGGTLKIAAVDYVAPNKTQAPVSNNQTNSSEDITGNAIEEINQSAVQENSAQNNTITNSFSIKETWAKVDLYIYIILGIIVLTGVARFAIQKTKETKSKKANFSEDIVIDNREVKKELEEAQLKIKEAQGVIDKITNRKQRFEDAQRKFNEAKRELESLKKGL